MYYLSLFCSSIVPIGLLKISSISFKCIKHQRLLWGECWYVSGHSKLSTRMKEESDVSFCKKMHSLISPNGAVQAEPLWEPLLQPSSFLFPSAASCHLGPGPVMPYTFNSQEEKTSNQTSQEPTGTFPISSDTYHHPLQLPLCLTQEWNSWMNLKAN